MRVKSCTFIYTESAQGKFYYTAGTPPRTYRGSPALSQGLRSPLPLHPLQRWYSTGRAPRLRLVLRRGIASALSVSIQLLVVWPTTACFFSDTHTPIGHCATAHGDYVLFFASILPFFSSLFFLNSLFFCQINITACIFLTKLFSLCCELSERAHGVALISSTSASCAAWSISACSAFSDSMAFSRLRSK